MKTISIFREHKASVSYETKIKTVAFPNSDLLIIFEKHSLMLFSKIIIGMKKLNNLAQNKQTHLNKEYRRKT